MLETKTYTIRELSAIIRTNGKTATDRKLNTYKISYTSEGCRNNLTYTITNIPDHFRVFCVFDLGFPPQTDFIKLRDFIFYLLGDDDFNWRPMEMMEEYLRIAGCGMSRQTISGYIGRLESLNLIACTEYVYYRVYKAFGVQKHEIVTKEEYSAAWGVYWNSRERGYSSRAAYSVMYNVFNGVPRKQRKIEENALEQDTLNLLSKFVAENFISESGS